MRGGALQVGGMARGRQWLRRWGGYVCCLPSKGQRGGKNKQRRDSAIIALYTFCTEKKKPPLLYTFVYVATYRLSTLRGRRVNIDVEEEKNCAWLLRFPPANAKVV
ncbi:hypothetical protein KM043_008129 [Ampulex compressa]|nr:hypothetical protein KM043_008129 [Ampulex compressa]